MRSIRFKIAAVSIGGVLIAILCVYFASRYTIQTEADHRSAQTLGLICQNTKKSLERYVESIAQSTEMAGSVAVDKLDSTVLVKQGVVGSSDKGSSHSHKQSPELDEYLLKYTAEVQDEAAIIASHTYGVVAYYYCLNPDLSNSEHGFFYSRAGKSGFEERESLDARTFDANDLEHYMWYYAPIQRGRPSWVGPYTAHFLGEVKLCSYLIPIYKAGALVGVLGMDIPVETLVSQVSSIKVYDTGFVCLIDEYGRVVYHPELPLGSTLDSSMGLDFLRQKDSGDEPIRYTHQGEERQLSFTTLSNGMKLAVVAPAREVNASSYRLNRMILLIAALAVSVLSIVALLLTRYITNPLQRLTAASQRLATGDYDVSLDYKGHDEVGALTTSFEHMRGQLQKNIAELNQKALTDALTGLPNQRHFFDLCDRERACFKESGKDAALLYFDLVDMKHFNQQYGFDEGDRLLCATADILADEFGPQRTSRFGQDQFAAICDLGGMEESLARVFKRRQTANGGRTLPLRVGVYSFSLEDVPSSVACDRAKYACDQQRGTYVTGYRLFDATMLRRVDTVRHVIDNLDRALEERWIQVYYQPIVQASTGRICDQEALSRWIDPTRGFLNPDDFIPALENAGLVYKIDLYVLDRVIEKIHEQRELGLPNIPHSINLSRSDFDSCDMVEEIRKRVDDAGVRRSDLSIEITESIIGSDFEFMKGEINRFRSLGFPVWMDDFGSGYSSLDVLQSIEFDLLKFDMSFLSKFNESDKGKTILTDLMRMATALGVDTICEGVETSEQYRFLSRIGCSKMQGYYFGKPMPKQQIHERLR